MSQEMHYPYTSKVSKTSEIIRDTLESVLIKDIYIPAEKLVTLNVGDTISKALQVLDANGINGAPVYDSINKHFFGFVDVLDICLFVVSTFSDTETWKLMTCLDGQELIDRFQSPLSTLINASALDPAIPVSPNDSISSLINGPFRQALHRVPVVDQDGNLIGMVSQTDILQYLHQNSAPFAPLLRKKLSELLHAEDMGSVISVRSIAPIVHAFTEMIRNHVTGIAVTGPHGQLLGNISASDLTGITEKNFFSLEAPAGQFGFQGKPFTCSLDATLEDVIRMLLDLRIHRLYVVDDQFRPINVVTTTTVIRILARSYYPSQQ